MSNLNRAIIQGRLTAYPELKDANGHSVVTFSVAVRRRGTGDNTDFIRCVAWNKTAEFLKTYFKKGQGIIVDGRLQVRSWESNDGRRNTVTELIADSVYFDGNNSQNADSKPVSKPTEEPKQEDFFQEVNEDEIPW